MTKVKICGLSTRAAAEVATESGASWLGAILSPGFRRSVLPQEARAMWDGLEPSHVGVWVNATEQEVLAGSDRAGAGVAQLAGVESPAAAKALRHALTVWKVVRPANWYELEMEARQWNGAVDALVVEGSSETGASGGAGLIAPWARLGDLSSFPLPIILAGGLTPLNVAEAISIVHPMAVDVSSGVETDGIKDETKIREFIERARAG